VGLTAEQRDAIEPAASVVVGASAGTGKTHVLTARLLRLLLEGSDPRAILCLTFTKAAAAEMKTRVSGELGRWTRLSDAALAARLADRLGIAADAAMCARARRLFAQVVDLPSGLEIQTFHGFCQSLLKRFPLEAGLVPHFRVAEEAQAADLLGQARDQLLDAPDAALSRAIARLAAVAHEDAFAALMRALVHERPRLARLLVAVRTPQGLDHALRRTTGAEPLDEDAILADGLSQIDPADLNRLQALFERHGGKKEQAFASRLAQGYPSLMSVFFTNDKARRKGLPSKQVCRADPAAEALCERICGALEALEDRLARARLFANSRAALTLAQALMARYGALKARDALLDYDDLILASAALLADPGRAAWILYKLDQRLEHILIDEAQDTNPEQWQVAGALWQEFFAGSGARGARVRTVFAVGDQKQSIYGFQRADPAGFARARAALTQLAAGAGHRFAAVPLNRSFRSTAAVLDTVDAVFADPELAGGLGETEIQHQVHRIGAGGEVCLWPIEPKPRQDASEPWRPPLTQTAPQAAEARLAERIACHIAQSVEGGEILQARNRPIRYGDYLVLVQRRGRFVDDFARACHRRGVPIAGTDRLRLNEHLAVLDLIAAARCVLLPDDDLTLATVLKGPLIGLEEEALFDLAYDRGDASLVQRLKDRSQTAPFADAWQQIRRWQARADRMRPYEFFAALLIDEDGRRKLLHRLGLDAADVIDAFLEETRAAERHGAASLERVVHRIERSHTELKREQEEVGDKVRIMTVHGAKGLQAPIVFLPDTTADPGLRAGQAPLLIADDPFAGPLPLYPASKEQEVGAAKAARERLVTSQVHEDHRLLYVAMTRAEDRLYVAGWQGHARREQELHGCWYEQIRRGLERLNGVEQLPCGTRRYRQSQAAPVAADSPSPVDCPEPAPLPRWLRQPLPAEPQPARPLAPSRPDPQPAARSPLQVLDYRRGRLIHRLLEILPDLPPAQRAAAARHYLSRPAHGLSTETAAAWTAEVMAVLSDPDFSSLFGPGSRAEVPLCGVVEGRVISGRIDRLLVTAQDILIVDYKTNRPAPADAADIPEAYRRQMLAYKALLHGLFPNRALRAALLWTDGPRLMPIDV